MSNSFSSNELVFPRSLGKQGSFKTIRGTFARFGRVYREGPGGTSVYDKKVLLKDVETLDKRFGTDHLWIDYCSELKGIKSGDIVQLSGVVAPYSGKHKKDNHLINIQNILINPN